MRSHVDDFNARDKCLTANFGKELPTWLAVFSHCILSICNFIFFPVLVFRAGFPVPVHCLQLLLSRALMTIHYILVEYTGCFHFVVLTV